MIISSTKQQRALDYAITVIKNSPVFPYVNGLYLYGSCSRKEQRPDSDVDLFLELCPSILDCRSLKPALRLLKTEVMTDDFADPEVDLKIVFGDEWKSSNMLYYENVKRDGVSLCL